MQQKYQIIKCPFWYSEKEIVDHYFRQADDPHREVLRLPDHRRRPNLAVALKSKI